MPTSDENPIQPCQQAGPSREPLAADPPTRHPQAGHCRPTLRVGARAVPARGAPGRPAGNRQTDPAPRPSKSVLLPQIVQLSLEGHSGRAISNRLRVPRRTVDRWLREQRRQWTEQAAESSMELFAVARARLESVYREAMEAWRRSLADQQVTVETSGDDEDAVRQTTVRRATQSGQASLLDRAMRAATAICDFSARHFDSMREAKTAEARRRLSELAEELGGLPRKAFRKIIMPLTRDRAHLAADRRIEEITVMLLDLSAADYTALRAIMSNEYDRALPRIPARNAEATLEPLSGVPLFDGIPAKADGTPAQTVEPLADRPSRIASNPGPSLSGGCVLPNGDEVPVSHANS